MSFECEFDEFVVNHSFYDFYDFDEAKIIHSVEFDMFAISINSEIPYGEIKNAYVGITQIFKSNPFIQAKAVFGEELSSREILCQYKAFIDYEGENKLNREIFDSIFRLYKSGKFDNNIKYGDRDCSILEGIIEDLTYVIEKYGSYERRFAYLWQSDAADIMREDLEMDEEEFKRYCDSDDFDKEWYESLLVECFYVLCDRGWFVVNHESFDDYEPAIKEVQLAEFETPSLFENDLNEYAQKCFKLYGRNPFM